MCLFFLESRVYKMYQALAFLSCIEKEDIQVHAAEYVNMCKSIVRGWGSGTRPPNPSKAIIDTCTPSQTSLHLVLRE